jgi:protein-tyrosine phosphatase
MVNDGLKVYVHCTAGMGRAPAVVLCFLIQFNEMDPDDGDCYIKSFRSVSVPNLKIVKQAIAEHRASQHH